MNRSFSDYLGRQDIANAVETARCAAAAHVAKPVHAAFAKAAIDAADLAYGDALTAYTAAFEAAIGSIDSPHYMNPERRHTPALLALYDAMERAGDAQTVAQSAYDDLVAEQAIDRHSRRGGW